jgi:hypothetical protein
MGLGIGIMVYTSLPLEQYGTHTVSLLNVYKNQFTVQLD